MSPDDRYLSPAEVARQLGVGVRALRLYERRGLLEPVRTSAGWRTYGPKQISRLHEILALKGLGLSLARIAELLAGRASDLGKTLEVQSTALLAQRARIDAALRLIEAAGQKLARGESLPITDLIELIRETTSMSDQPSYVKAYAAQLEKQLTPDERDRLRRGMESSRLELYAELKTLAEREEDPFSPASIDFMRRWSHLHSLLIGSDMELGLKARAAWRDAVADPEAAEGALHGDAEVRYLTAVGEAIGAAWRRLFARADEMAGAHVDPASPEAMALVMRMRGLSSIYNGHRSEAWLDQHRAQFLQTRTPGTDAPASDAGFAFLTRASACTEALVETV